MPYKIQLPNKQIVEIDDDVPQEQARLMIARRYPDLFNRPQGFKSALGAGFDDAAANIQTFGADVADKIGLDGVAGKLRKYADKNKQEIAKGFDPTTSEDVDAAFDRGIGAGIGAFMRKNVAEPVGGMVGSLGPAAAGAAVGALSPVPGGATMGFAAPYFAQSAGANQERQRQVNPNEDPNLLNSTITALAQTALGTFGFGKMVHGALGSQIAMREAAQVAPKVLSGEMTKDAAVAALGSRLRNVAAETGASFAINTGTGVADEALRRTQAGQALGDSDALRTYKEIAGTAALLAPVFGAAHGLPARGRAQRLVEDQHRARENQRIQAEQAEQARLQQEAALQEEQAAAQAAEQAQLEQQAAAQRAAEQEAAQIKLQEDIRRGAAAAVEARDDPRLAAMREDAQAAFASPEPQQVQLREADPFVRSEGQPKPAAEPVPVPDPVTKPGLPDAELPGIERLSKSEDFADVVFPRAKIMKDNLLAGHDLNTPDGVQKLIDILTTYESKMVSDTLRPKLQERINELDQRKSTLEARDATPVSAPDNQPSNLIEPVTPAGITQPVAALADAGDGVPAVRRAADGGIDDPAAGKNLVPQNEPAAAPDRLPDADQGRPAGRDAAPEPADTGKGTLDRALTPLQERAKFGKDIGAVVRARGHYLTGRQNLRLGQAMEAGNFEGVVDALGTSKNPVVRHIAEQAGKLEGVKVKLADDMEMYERDRTLEVDNGNARIQLSMYDALKKHLPELEATGKIPKALRDEPVPLLAGMHGLGDNPTFGDALYNNVRTPEAYKQELGLLEQFMERNGGVDKVRQYANNKITATGAEGMYDPKTKTASATPYRAKDEHTVAHELVHAMTVDAIDNPTPAQRPIVAKLDKLYQHVKDVMSKAKATDYGISSLHEFVAEAYTNPDFQQKLSKIKYENTTAWGKFTEYVAKLLGLKNDNAFTEFLSLQEQLEGTPRGMPSPESTPKFLGRYEQSTKPEIPKGAVGTMASGMQAARTGEGGFKGALKRLRDTIEAGMFDEKYGVTRHLENAWTRVVGGQREATAKALLQASTYGAQMGRESLSMGTVKKNAEGFWKIEKSDINLKSFLDAVQALDTDTDKFQVANGILTNLNYAEREAMLGANKAAAIQMRTQAQADLKAARKLKGSAAAKGIRSAQARIDMANDLLDTEYKRPASVTDETIAQAKIDAQDPKVKAMLDIVRQMNHQNIDILQEGGKISKETADLWKERQHYVPLQRLMEEDMQGQDALFARGGASTRDIQRFKGSEREVGDITENLIRQRLYAVDAAVRNNANLKAIEELSAVPGNPAGVRAYGQNRPSNVSQMIPAVSKDGVKQYYAVEDPMAYRTLRGMIEDAPQIINAMEGITHFFREAIMLSPDAILRNLMRDSQEIWAYNATNKNIASILGKIFGQVGRSLPGVVKEGFGHKLHQPHYDVSAFGITGVKEFTSLGKERAQIIREQIKRTGTRDWADSTDRILDAIARIKRPLENLATEGELAPRNVVFKEVLARTGSETEAAMAAINTLDFRRRGSWQSITYAKKLIPFFNSSLQGFYKLYQTVARNDNLSAAQRDAARRTLLIQGMKMAVAASVYQSVMQDDDEYMQVPKQIRDTAILVPTGDGVFFKIALPFEFGTAFWTMPANIVATLSEKQDTQALVKAMKDGAMHMLPSAIPQAVKPLLENAANYSFFTGKPLESQAMQRVAPEQRAYDTTTDTAKAIGEATGTSPIKVDNLLRGYFGSLGAAVIAAVDNYILGDGTDPDKAWHRAPVAKSLFTDPLASESRNKFYELRTNADQVYTTAQQMAKKSPDEAQQYLEQETNGVPNKTLYAMHGRMAGLDRYLQQASAREKAIKASDASPELKRAQLEQIRKAANFKLKEMIPGLQAALRGGDEEAAKHEEETEEETEE